MIRRCRVHRFGANLNTDDIIAGKYKHKTMDIDELAAHAMENVRPGFAQDVSSGDAIVAGANFGCGSSREQAPQILAHIGIHAVIAPSFSRIFFRNSINIGLTLIEGSVDRIGDEVDIDLQARFYQVPDDPDRRPIPPLPAAIEQIAAAGGLLAYVRQHGSL